MVCEHRSYCYFPLQQPVIEAIRVEIKNLKGNQVGQAEDVKERPKIRGYRGFRGGRRRGDASSRRPTRTPTPESVDDPGGNGNDKGALLLGPGQFKAHVEEVDKKKYVKSTCFTSTNTVRRKICAAGTTHLLSSPRILTTPTTPSS